MRCMKCFRNVNISNGLFFFERCILITSTACAKKFSNCALFNLYAHTIAVIRIHLSKKNSPLLKYYHDKGHTSYGLCTRKNNCNNPRRFLCWHISPITCQIIMSSCQIFMFTCQIFFKS